MSLPLPENSMLMNFPQSCCCNWRQTEEFYPWCNPCSHTKQYDWNLRCIWINAVVTFPNIVPLSHFGLWCLWQWLHSSSEQTSSLVQCYQSHDERTMSKFLIVRPCVSNRILKFATQLKKNTQSAALDHFYSLQLNGVKEWLVLQEISWNQSLEFGNILHKPDHTAKISFQIIFWTQNTAFAWGEK